MDKKTHRILFYTYHPRAFRTTLIGHLYEVAQSFPVILLSEQLDPETENIIHDKQYFPNVEAIIKVNQFTGVRKNILKHNKALYQLAKRVVKQYDPDIIITGSDMHSLFDLYLTRIGKRKGARVIAIQPAVNVADASKRSLWQDLTNAYQKFPIWLPLFLRLIFVQWRKYAGHSIHYYVLPLLVGEKPFFGKSSHILRKGNSGMRNSDCQVGFSQWDYDIFQQDGVPSERIFILPHPLMRETRKFFEKVYLHSEDKHHEQGKTITFMLQGDIPIGFRREDYSLISLEDRIQTWKAILSTTVQLLPHWKIFIKPHPATMILDLLQERLVSIADSITLVNAHEPSDIYIEQSDIIVGLPFSGTTTLYTASLQCPEKPILALDIHHEFLGDVYRNFEGIEYVDSMEAFMPILRAIKDNVYQKKYNNQSITIENRTFNNTIDVINQVLKKKRTPCM
ncbi:MAG: hypothetical protein KKH94_09385 [Candidatus Omnitrophica bacterium]|nr:hypothetical protein [Candidatus Omnitrophota bacterium]